MVLNERRYGEWTVHYPAFACCTQRPWRILSSATLSKTPQGCWLPAGRCGRSLQVFSPPRIQRLQRILSSACRARRIAFRLIVTLPARVKRASPVRQAWNPRGIRVSWVPDRKRPIDAGSSATRSETPKRRGILASRFGQLLRVFNPLCFVQENA